MDIVVNFLKQEKFSTLRSSQGPTKSTKEFARSTGSARLVAGSTNMKEGFAGANQDHIHPNLKFGPTSTKPKG